MRIWDVGLFIVFWKLIFDIHVSHKWWSRYPREIMRRITRVHLQLSPRSPKITNGYFFYLKIKSTTSTNFLENNFSSRSTSNLTERGANVWGRKLSCHVEDVDTPKEWSCSWQLHFEPPEVKKLAILLIRKFLKWFDLLGFDLSDPTGSTYK